MKAFVHIGTEKTGTTSIQSFLYRNRSKLQREGFHFLQCAGKTNNRALPTYCMSNDQHDDFYKLLGITTQDERAAYKKDFVDRLEKELSGLPSNTRAVVISSEHFHSRLRTSEEVGNVLKLLSSYFTEIEIVCYLRDQITTCTSVYSTALKSGNSSSFVEFVRRCSPGNYYFNYWEMLQNWERSFGFEALTVALFSPEHLLNGNLLDDFLARLDAGLVGKFNTNMQNENESLNTSGQALARAVNLTFPVRSSRPELQLLREKCQHRISEHHKGKGRQLSPHSQREVFEAFAEINESVRQRYFPDQKQILEPPAIDADFHTIAVDEFIAGFEAILEIVRKEGRKVVQKEEFSGIYNILFSCINELLYKYGEVKMIHSVSSENIKSLRDLANRVGEFNVPAAEMLLQSMDALDSAASRSESVAGAV